MSRSTETLRSETASLASALNASSVRGAWGEVQLRRVLELSGLLARCDFDEQVTRVSRHGATVRPDAVINLPGGRTRRRRQQGADVALPSGARRHRVERSSAPSCSPPTRRPCGDTSRASRARPTGPPSPAPPRSSSASSRARPSSPPRSPTTRASTSTRSRARSCSPPPARCMPCCAPSAPSGSRTPWSRTPASCSPSARSCTRACPPSAGTSPRWASRWPARSSSTTASSARSSHASSSPPAGCTSCTSRHLRPARPSRSVPRSLSAPELLKERPETAGTRRIWSVNGRPGTRRGIRAVRDDLTGGVVVRLPRGRDVSSHNTSRVSGRPCRGLPVPRPRRGELWT